LARHSFYRRVNQSPLSLPIELWLQTKHSPATREAYARDVADFQNWADKTLRDQQFDVGDHNKVNKFEQQTE